MNLSSTLRGLSWALAIALSGMTSVAYAGDCQEEYGRETDKINAEFKEKLAQCHYRGSGVCKREAVSTKAEGIKAAGEKLRLCYRTDGQVTDPPEEEQKPRKPIRPTAPKTWSKQGPDLVWTDPKGRPWTFKPTSTDYEGREFKLDKNSVRVWQHATKGEIVSATYRYRNPMVAPDHEERITVDGKRVPGY